MIGRLVNYLILGGLVLLVVAWALVLRPQSLGGSALYVVVRGESMVPIYQSGDLVVVRSETAYALRDIIAYRVPSGEIGAGHIVIHRIVGPDAGSGFMVKGDHNPAPDPWAPHAADIAGRAWLVAPGLGRVIAFILQPVIVGGLASGLVVMVLMARPPRRRPDVGRRDADSRRRPLEDRQ